MILRAAMCIFICRRRREKVESDSVRTCRGRHKACPCSGLGEIQFCLKVMLLQPTLLLMVMDHLGESGVKFEKSLEL